MDRLAEAGLTTFQLGNEAGGGRALAETRVGSYLKTVCVRVCVCVFCVRVRVYVVFCVYVCVRVLSSQLKKPVPHIQHQFS